MLHLNGGKTVKMNALECDNYIWKVENYDRRLDNTRFIYSRLSMKTPTGWKDLDYDAKECDRFLEFHNPVDVSMKPVETFVGEMDDCIQRAMNWWMGALNRDPTNGVHIRLC